MQQSEAETFARPRLHYGTFRETLREIAETVVLIAVIFTLVNLACARFVVDGPSMQPNFHTGQFIIVSRVNYLLGNPHRGEVVVFHYPNNPTQDYIKRVVGLPGDTVEIRDTLVYVNGDLLNEPYINEPCQPSSCRNNSWTLGEDEYFMMGDNRNNSRDSRVFGPITKNRIIGEAIIRYWPPQDWGIVTRYRFPEA